MENLPRIRCGHCNWLMANHCQNVLEHECFKGYNETADFLNIDENFVATIAQKSTEAEGTESFQYINADIDERLIMAVMDRPSLYDHRLHIKERTKLKKSALWEEVRNIIGGNTSIKDLQKRWKYHRDCYIRARKKIKEYVPSGSGASSTNVKYTYKFFELMRSLDDTLSTKSTINSLSIQQNPSTLFNMENFVTDCSDIELSNTSTPVISPTPETPKPTLKTTKKRKLQNESIIQTVLLDVLKTPVPQTDAIDGFLKTLGEALRRLPYRKRTMMEIKFLQMVLEAEAEEAE